MIETVTSQTGEIVTLEEAKRQLGVWDSADDARVDLMLKAARAYCEGWGEITLRQSATRAVKCSDWPVGGWVLKHPPVTAVSSVTYYDANGTSQTFSSSNYRTHLTAAGFGRVEYVDGVALPSLADRSDAITLTYVTGWGTQDAAPEDAKAAILLTLTSLFGEDDTRNLAYAETAAKQLLSGISAWTYA